MGDEKQNLTLIYEENKYNNLLIAKTSNSELMLLEFCKLGYLF